MSGMCDFFDITCYIESFEARVQVLYHVKAIPLKTSVYIMHIDSSINLSYMVESWKFSVLIFISANFIRCSMIFFNFNYSLVWSISIFLGDNSVFPLT